MIDGYGRKITYLRLSVTELCDLRCRYCMPEHGVSKKSHEEMLSEEEMVLAAKAGIELGITKIRITGGEPLVKSNILSICQRISSLDGLKELCLTTNGVRLGQYAQSLYEAGVRRINVSLDTLNREKYAYMTRRDYLQEVLSGIQEAIRVGFEQVKLNVVLIGGFNDDEVEALAKLTREYPVDVRFIELMPMYDGGEFQEQAFVPVEHILERLPKLEPLEQRDGVSRLYRLPGAKGNVGLIHPISNHFCGTCNRLRLTADGKLKPCLHSELEYNIKGLDYEEMKAQFQKAVMGKPLEHGTLSVTERSKAGRTMNQIGG